MSHEDLLLAGVAVCTAIAWLTLRYAYTGLYPWEWRR